MNGRTLKAAVVHVQRAEGAIPGDLDGIVTALGDVDELLGELSSYLRRLSVVVEGLPGRIRNLQVNEMAGTFTAESVCEPAAVHLQAAAAGIDQAETAVNVAHRLAGRLHVQFR